MVRHMLLYVHVYCIVLCKQMCNFSHGHHVQLIKKQFLHATFRMWGAVYTTACVRDTEVVLVLKSEVEFDEEGVFEES